jgi:hypothetical protein
LFLIIHQLLFLYWLTVSQYLSRFSSFLVRANDKEQLVIATTTGEEKETRRPVWDDDDEAKKTRDKVVYALVRQCCSSHSS